MTEPQSLLPLCGGIVTTQRVILSDDAVQLVSQSDRRTRTTVRAAPGNTAPVYITTGQNIGWAQGLPLLPGEAYEFTDRGSRSVLYGLTSGVKTQTLHLITESA